MQQINVNDIPFIESIEEGGYTILYNDGSKEVISSRAMELNYMGCLPLVRYNYPVSNKMLVHHHVNGGILSEGHIADAHVHISDYITINIYISRI